MIFFFIVLLALALELLLADPRARISVVALGRKMQALVPQRFVPFALAALVITFGIELTIVWRAAHVAFAHLPWVAQLPIPTVTVYPIDYVPQSYRAAFAAISVVQTLLVGVFLLAASDRPWRRADTVASVLAAAVMALLAVVAPAMTVADMYAYVGYALLGSSHAYSPPLTPFTGEFAIIHRMWGTPLVPAAYGPLWLSFNSAVVGLASGLYAKLIVLRLVNVGMLAIALGALRLLGVAPRFIAATAANPAIAFHYLTNGHNDLVVIAIILVSMTVAARSPLAAGIIAGVAASLKLTLVVPAATVALIISGLSRRLAYVAVMVCIAGAIALIFGGKPYLHALNVVADMYSNSNKMARVRIPHIIVAAATVGLTLLAVLARRAYKSAAFGFVSLAQAYYPWYTIWGLPYAASRSDLLATLLVGLPVATALLDSIRFKYLGPLILVMLVIAIGAALVQRAKLTRTTVVA